MMKRVCAWCGETLGVQPGEGVTHGICPKCADRVRSELGLCGGGSDWEARSIRQYLPATAGPSPFIEAAHATDQR
jgi:hypothetical protein